MSKNRVLSFIALSYGLLLIVFGYVGYKTAGSIPSVGMGSLFGVWMLISARALSKSRKGGLYSTLVVSLLLSAFFSFRFLMTHKVMPAGIFALFSIAVLLIFLKALSQFQRDSVKAPGN